MRTHLPLIIAAVVTWLANAATSGLVRGTIMWVVFFGGGYWTGVFYPWKNGRA